MNDLAPPYPEEALRALPHAVGPEKAVLSCLIRDPRERIPEAIAERLTAAHFYLPAHQILFETVIRLHDEGKEIELVSLVQILLDRGLLDRVGGPAGVYDVFNYSATGAHFRQHVAMIRAKFIQRSLIRVCNDLTAAAYDTPEASAELLDQAEASILAIRDEGETRTQGTVAEALDEIVIDLENLTNGHDSTRGLTTGFPMLDRMTRGLKPGELFVIAARPSMGKTAFMMNIVEAVAIDQGHRTLVFSLEMTRRGLVERLLSARAKLSSAERVVGWRPDKGALARIQRATREIHAAPLIIDDAEALTITELRAKARRHHRAAPLALIAIDYLGLLRSHSRQAQNSREREISEISAGVKALAKELAVPIVILAQLNRGPESRVGKGGEGGRPRMSDLRDSGSIEQDADLVGLLWRSAYYAETDEQREAEAGRAELNLAKNRNGATGTVPLTFIDELTRFEEGAPVRQAPPPPTPRSRFDRLA